MIITSSYMRMRLSRYRSSYALITNTVRYTVRRGCVAAIVALCAVAAPTRGSLDSSNAHVAVESLARACEVPRGRRAGGRPRGLGATHVCAISLQKKRSSIRLAAAGRGRGRRGRRGRRAAARSTRVRASLRAGEREGRRGCTHQLRNRVWNCSLRCTAIMCA